MTLRKVIFLELNEIPRKIIDAFVADYPSSTFAQILPHCHQYQTQIDDAVLSPWIAWPTVHRGVLASTHGISNLGEDLTSVDAHYPPIWEILTRHNVRTGVFGSLHSYPLPIGLDRYAYYIPDAFAQDSQCFPLEMSIFQAFNLALTRQSSRNISGSIPVGLATVFLRESFSLGVTPNTLMALGKQVILERFRSERKSRRRTYQSVLSFDLFFKQLTKHQPSFTTYFTNHVASAMHRYWAAAFPEDYSTIGFSDAWMRTYGQEINFAMDKFSGFLDRLLKFINTRPDYMLWIVSAMGQAATTADPIRTQLCLTQPRKLMDLIGIPSEGWTEAPAMFPISSFHIHDVWVDVFRRAIESLRINDCAIEFEEKNQGFFSLLLGQKNINELAGKNVWLQSESYFSCDLGLENIAIEDASCASAYHIPQGSLLIYDPLGQSINTKPTPISVLAIAPTLLELFNVPVPDYMMPADQRSPLRQVVLGRSEAEGRGYAR